MGDYDEEEVCTLYRITKAEQQHILESLFTLIDEVEAIKEDTNHVFTTGVEEMLEESIKILSTLKEERG